MRIVYWPRPCLTLRLLARGSFASMLHTRRPPVRDVCSHGRNTIAPICPLHRPATWSSSWAPPLPQLLRHTPSSSHPNGGCSTLAAGSGVDLSALGIDIPDIDADVASYQSQLGAVFDERGVARTFNNTDLVLPALKAGVALLDRSHWGRLRLSGEDRLSFLHNQSTNDFNSRKPGEGCDTVFVTATGRCLDLATALVQDSGVLLLVSPSMKQQLLERFDKYIFPADKVAVADISPRTKMFTLLGPGAADVLQEVAGDAFKLADAEYGRHQLLRASGGAPVILAVGTGLMVPGYTLIVDEGGAPDLYARLINKGVIPMGEDDWERARVTAGRPAPGAELTQDYNPLEAGLYHAVSITKGCYMGQETLAKVGRAGPPKQQLWGLQLTAPVAPGTPVQYEGDVIGSVTSYVDLQQYGDFALAYLKRKRKGTALKLEGAAVTVDGQPATVVAAPYSTWEFLDGDGTSEAEAPAAAAAAAGAPGSQQQQSQQSAEKAAEAAAKAERLRAMQERLAAWQSQQQGKQ